jgi:glycosyltransferase involved in cell wall biosynthesis
MKQAVMIGTRRDTLGGIAAVINVYAAAGLFDRFPVRYLASHRDGSAWDKLATVAGALLRFAWMLLRGQVALVHVHAASRASFWRKSLFLALARLARVPAVLHLHGGEFKIFYGQECGPLRRRFIRSIFDHCARVVVLSEAWREWVASISTNPHIDVVRNPVLLPATVAEWSQRRPGQVLCLGRMNRGKGSYDLLQAAALAGTPLHVSFGGDGEAEQVRARARELGIAEQVSVLGWVQAGDKARELDRANMFVLASYNEGLPMSVLEAMAAGVPVVSTPVGGIPEAVSDGVEGFLVEPGDVAALARRLAQLAQDPALAKRMGAAARRKVESTFAAGAVVPRIEQIYLDLGCART